MNHRLSKSFTVCGKRKILIFPINDYKNILAVEFLVYLAMDYISGAHDEGTFLLWNMWDWRGGRERIAEFPGRLA